MDDAGLDQMDILKIKMHRENTRRKRKRESLEDHATMLKSLVNRLNKKIDLIETDLKKYKKKYKTCKKEKEEIEKLLVQCMNENYGHSQEGGARDSRLVRAGVSGYNKPKRTPSHPTKSHIVVAKEGNKIKTIRFGQQGVRGSPKRKGESEYHKKRRKSFKARHAKNIAKGKMSAAYWSNKVKW